MTSLRFRYYVPSYCWGNIRSNCFPFPIGAGIAIPAGAMANEIYQQGGDNKLVCAVWNTDIPSHKNEYKVEVSTVFVSFFVPVIVMLFPFIALLMQVCGGRQPR